VASPVLPFRSLLRLSALRPPPSLHTLLRFLLLRLPPGFRVFLLPILSAVILFSLLFRSLLRRLCLDFPRNSKQSDSPEHT
jgi:hypothetical protein